MIRAVIDGKTLELVQADITKENVDAVVTAANRLLSGGNQAGFGGGVDGAIHRAAGPELLDACLQIGGCSPGEAVATHAGRLAAKRVIHAVGPVWGAHEGEEDALLASAHRRSLEVAAEEGCTSIAFPAISCGVYHFPLERAASVAMEAVADHLLGETSIKLVRYCLFSEDVYHPFAHALEDVAARNDRIELTEHA